MHKVETGYTVYYNQRHRESGHLMQGRYGAKTVEGDDYLLALARYVHLNPKCIFSLLHPTQSVAWVAERERRLPEDAAGIRGKIQHGGGGAN
jgi:hypothetical protein